MILHKFLNILDFNTKGRWLKMTDEQYIDIAIEISKNAKYPYGAIVVKDNQIIGRSDENTLMETSMYSHA